MSIYDLQTNNGLIAYKFLKWQPPLALETALIALDKSGYADSFLRGQELVRLTEFWKADGILTKLPDFKNESRGAVQILMEHQARGHTVVTEKFFGGFVTIIYPDHQSTVPVGSGSGVIETESIFDATLSFVTQQHLGDKRQAWLGGVEIQFTGKIQNNAHDNSIKCKTWFPITGSDFKLNCSDITDAFIKIFGGKNLLVQSMGCGFFRILKVDGEPPPLIIELAAADFETLCATTDVSEQKYTIEISNLAGNESRSLGPLCFDWKLESHGSIRAAGESALWFTSNVQKLLHHQEHC